MKNQKIIIAVLAGIFLVLLALVLNKKIDTLKQKAINQTITVTTPIDAHLVIESLGVDYRDSEFHYTVLAKSGDGIPQKIGEYIGDCKQLVNSEKDYFGETAQVDVIDRVQCYFAGAGDQIIIKKELSDMVVYHRVFSEGIEGAAPFAEQYIEKMRFSGEIIEKHVTEISSDL